MAIIHVGFETKTTLNRWWGGGLLFLFRGDGSRGQKLENRWNCLNSLSRVVAYPSSLQALHSNTYKQIIQHNRIKNSDWQEATSWLFSSMAEGLNSGRPRTNLASHQRGT